MAGCLKYSFFGKCRDSNLCHIEHCRGERDFTLNSDDTTSVVSQIGMFDAQPILDAIIGTPFDARIVIYPQAVAVSRQWAIENPRIIYAARL